MAEDRPGEHRARVVSHQRVYSGRVLDLDVDEIEGPGGIRATREVVRHPGSIVVMAVDERDRLVLVRQYRYPVGAALWEIPAGRQDPGESPEEGARRELEEEVGVRAAQWERLLSFYVSPGFCDEVMHLFRATELSAVPPRPEPDEDIEVRWLTLTEAIAMADRSEVRDAKTLLALMLEERRRGL
jgi:ADP-ribose pyrophosphatase